VISELYRDADKSLARPTSQRVLFDGGNIYFDASMIIKRTYEIQKSSVAVAFFLPGRAKDLLAPLYCKYSLRSYKTQL